MGNVAEPGSYGRMVEASLTDGVECAKKIGSEVEAYGLSGPMTRECSVVGRTKEMVWRMEVFPRGGGSGG